MLPMAGCGPNIIPMALRLSVLTKMATVVQVVIVVLQIEILQGRLIYIKGKN